ncbi:VOC family protein [Spirosoma arcticum]
MIDGLFETHIPVVSLDASMHFYGQVLGLELGRFSSNRRVAFYWIGQRGKAMLGFWEKPRHQVIPQHYAFRCSIEAITGKSVQFLERRGLGSLQFPETGNWRTDGVRLDARRLHLLPRP